MTTRQIDAIIGADGHIPAPWISLMQEMLDPRRLLAEAALFVGCRVRFKVVAPHGWTESFRGVVYGEIATAK